MSKGRDLLPEFDQEMRTTRTLLERVPDAEGAWKPHPKSFSLGHLAQLISWMPGWITLAVRDDRLDLSGAPPYSLESTQTLLEQFDRNVAQAREALASVSDDELVKPWSLTHGSVVLMTLPKGDVVRQNISHLVHHRGQLSVYLRLVDVPLPPIYGPTADSSWQPMPAA